MKILLLLLLLLILNIILIDAQETEFIEIDNKLKSFVEGQHYHKSQHDDNKQYDYIFEAYKVPILNWKLGLHRVYAKEYKDDILNRPAVFLQHGLLDTSASWFVTGSSNAIAFVLAQKGYDVYLGNFRGNMFSRGSGILTDEQNDKSRWFFGFEAHTLVDIRAMLNEVKIIRNSNVIHGYIGHSMGGLAFLDGMSGLHKKHYYEELNKFGSGPFTAIKIEHFIGLSPAVYTPKIDKLKKFVLGLADKLLGKVELFSILSKIDTKRSLKRTLTRHVVNAVSQYVAHPRLSASFCRHAPAACKKMICMIAGCSSASNWEEFIPNMVPFAPGSTSWNVIRHFLQNDATSNAAIELLHERSKPSSVMEQMPVAFDWFDSPFRKLKKYVNKFRNSKIYTTPSNRQSLHQHHTLTSNKEHKPLKHRDEAPPRYNLCNLLEKMNTNMHIFYSDYDPLVRPDGVALLAHQLKMCNAEKATEKLKFIHIRNFGHIDFTLGSHLNCEGELTADESAPAILYPIPEEFNIKLCRRTINDEILNILK